MKSKKISLAAIFVLSMALCTASAAFCAASPDVTGVNVIQTEVSAFEGLNKVETRLYGAEQTGGLLLRLAKAEKDLFGRELPGSLIERQTALLNFLEKTEPGQPSFIFKLYVVEWLIGQKAVPDASLEMSMARLEEVLEGQIQSGPLAMRLERLIAKLLPEGVPTALATVPIGTVIKTRLLTALSVNDIKTGDNVKMEVAEDLKIDNKLIAPIGSPIIAFVSSASGPKSFGRPSEIKIGFNDIQTLGPQLIPVIIGPNAKKATEDVEKSYVGAAGASLLGALILGPVGLAGGFLIRGDNKIIPEGTMMFVETSNSTSVYGFAIPQAMTGAAPTPTQ